MPSDLRQEPSAVIPLAGICAGGAGSAGVPTANESPPRRPQRHRLELTRRLGLLGVARHHQATTSESQTTAYLPVSTQESKTRTFFQFPCISSMNCLCRGASWYLSWAALSRK